jgi:hypothetical protein
VTLAALLDAGARFDAEYRGGLSNHLPMALIALRRLGADDTRLAAFAQGYSTRLGAAPAAEAFPAGDAWAGRLGERAAWPAYRSLFAEWLSYEGAERVLPQVLPALMPGCGAAAFHGLIRTAYALQTGHLRELADALAYWSCRHLPLDGRPAATHQGLIFEAMQDAAAAPGFDAAVTALALDAGTLDRLAHEAATLYAASGNFVVLHLVTGCHAMRVLLPLADEPLVALHHFSRAWLAGRRASGARRSQPARLLPWHKIVAAALASDDEHLIKLVDSCREEEAAYGEGDWRRAAARAVRAARSAGP